MSKFTRCTIYFQNLFHQSLDRLGQKPSQCYDTSWGVQRYWALGPVVLVLALPYVKKSWKLLNIYRLYQALLFTLGYLLVTYNRMQVQVLNPWLHITQANTMFALLSQPCLVCSGCLCLLHIPQYSSLQLTHIEMNRKPLPTRRSLIAFFCNVPQVISLKVQWNPISTQNRVPNPFLKSPQHVG